MPKRKPTLDSVTVTFLWDDGTEIRGHIDPTDASWSQEGADKARLGENVDRLQAMARALVEAC